MSNIADPIVFVSSVNREMTYADFIHALFKHDEQPMEYMHAALGICGEAGEVADAIKKHVVYGKPLDRNNLVEELGDMRFYMQQVMNMLGITEDEVLQGNAHKLSKRYPTGGYSDKDAVTRADKIEDKPFNPHDYDDWKCVHPLIYQSEQAGGYVFSDEASQYDTNLHGTFAECEDALASYIKQLG